MNVATGFSVNSIPYSFYTGYLSDHYTISKSETAVVPHILVSLSHAWSGIVSPLTGNDDIHNLV
jgi:hypothetical protein